MPRAALSIALLSLVLAAAALAGPQISQPCATVIGPAWTQTINLAANLPPPREDVLRRIRGSRYYVFVDHVNCALAKKQVAKLIALRTRARLHSASPPPFACYAGPSGWFRDVFNGDAVRRTWPVTSTGICSTQKTDAVPGVAYRTFFWSPAKPCRSFITDTCRG
jgi:hypothetical protein